MSNFDIERSRQARKTQDNIQTAIDLIFTELNHGSVDVVADLMLKNITKQHRTLQQCFWKEIFGVIKGYGELEYLDARNEAAVKACQKLAAAADDVGLPYI